MELCVEEDYRNDKGIGEIVDLWVSVRRFLLGMSREGRAVAMTVLEARNGLLVSHSLDGRACAEQMIAISFPSPLSQRYRYSFRSQ